ncbi:hypothetical protein GYMLUDRAFT_349608 [Collybiopsis luxurians FD-317 M1]|nr:hypothetical protein GYMLUDRAFT_349608 [Collybiopsis luxurians FD-317 M1]
MTSSLIFILLFLISCLLPEVTSSAIRPPSSLSRFRRAHSLGESYEFNPRDGWNTFNATARHAPRDGSSALEPRFKKASGKGKQDDTKVSVKDLALEAVGKVLENVIITWYTGHDLLNPSCWPQPVWTPTDESFVCAITLDGWEDKPKCFEFLELCNGPNKCIYVRVVDSCAGCAAGTKHVDLTKAAFSQLGDLNSGTLSISMRVVQPPARLPWDKSSWGPWEEA